MTPNDREYQDYLFDLRGYLVLRQAIPAAHVAACNAILDQAPPTVPGEWWGYVHNQVHQPMIGINLQQIYEAGAPFEELIDHPTWNDLVHHYVGSAGNFDSNHGPLYIDEAFANFRDPGQAISLHSGGDSGCIRCQYRYHAGRFHCGQVNILLALTDIGPGDGATMVIPGSHKSNLMHPLQRVSRYGTDSVDMIPEAIEVHLQAGDAILFVDAIAHGSAARVNPGTRRIVVQRYGPSWGRSRHGYEPSPELLARLTERRRSYLSPGRTRRPPQPTD